MNKLKIKLTGLTCVACVKVASKRIKEIEGVEDVVINLPTGETTIESSQALQIADVEDVLAKTHYSIMK